MIKVKDGTKHSGASPELYWQKSEESFVCCELHRAAEIRCLRSLLEGKQEVHDLPDLRQLSNPFAELLHVRLQPFERGILRVGGVSPERSNRLQQLTGHQVGEVGGPVLGDASDGDTAVGDEGEVPAREVQLLSREVQPVHGLMGQKETLAILTLLSGPLQR